MRTRFLAQKDSQIDAVDLRRIHTREFIQSICDRAKFLPDSERALLDEVYNLGKSVAEIAETRGEKISHLRRRVRRITNRVLDPRYRYVAENQGQWRPTRRKVASACVIEGLSIKEAETGCRRIFKWGVVDVLEHCTDEHECTTEAGADCGLLPECAGSAKERNEPGHITVSDAQTMKRRVSLPVWNAEMLSLEPRRTDCVYPDFDPKIHVVDHLRTEPGAFTIAGMDFGFRAPTVVLWAEVSVAGIVTVFAERSEKEIVIAKHAKAIADSNHPAPTWIGDDPAGRQRSGQTGQSDIHVLTQHGLTIKARPSRIAEGIALISARLKPASGKPSLFIHRRCTKLIEAMQQYHYPPDNPSSMEPVKDGPDHAVDALRYMLINLDNPHTATNGRYAPGR
jgi:hypothetical protein